ncbi:MAG: 30S ribosomal protein S17e [Candidatus Pacearchaeota archaeon]|nr:30S ribosomal protein S17e [Candidatus Pacearchaeota archaeon]
MGRIKSTLIKRTAKTLVAQSKFQEDFDENQRLLSGVIPSKKMKNMIAGYIARLEKQQRKKREILMLN